MPYLDWESSEEDEGEPSFGGNRRQRQSLITNRIAQSLADMTMNDSSQISTVQQSGTMTNGTTQASATHQDGMTTNGRSQAFTAQQSRVGVNHTGQMAAAQQNGIVLNPRAPPFINGVVTGGVTENVNGASVQANSPQGIAYRMRQQVNSPLIIDGSAQNPRARRLRDEDVDRYTTVLSRVVSFLAVNSPQPVTQVNDYEAELRFLVDLLASAPDDDLVRVRLQGDLIQQLQRQEERLAERLRQANREVVLAELQLPYQRGLWVGRRVFWTFARGMTVDAVDNIQGIIQAQMQRLLQRLRQSNPPRRNDIMALAALATQRRRLSGGDTVAALLARRADPEMLHADSVFELAAYWSDSSISERVNGGDRALSGSRSHGQFGLNQEASHGEENEASEPRVVGNDGVNESSQPRTTCPLPQLSHEDVFLPRSSHGGISSLRESSDTGESEGMASQADEVVE